MLEIRSDRRVVEFFEVARARADLPALTSVEYVQAAVQLANCHYRFSAALKLSAETTVGDVDRRLRDVDVSEALRFIDELQYGLPKPAADGNKEGPGGEQGKMDSFLGLVIGSSSTIAQFVKDLDALARNYKRARTLLLSKVPTSPTVALVPHFRQNATAMDVGYRFIARDLQSALWYVCALLLDDSTELGRNLSRCRLQECSKFFFAQPNPRGGPRRREYCSEEHMLEQHGRDAAHRMARKRRADSRAAAGKGGA